MWQELRDELHPHGLEIVTVSLEMSGPDASRDLIEAASPEHPSLLDPTHRMDALFGVVNIPNVVWIDEQGVIVRPPEPGWPQGASSMPPDMLDSMPNVGAAPNAPAPPEGGPGQWDVLGSGQDRGAYVEAIRDWVANGADSRYAMSPEQVVDASTERGIEKSQGAAHFELANKLWLDDERPRAIAHFNEAHRLQPDNWTYKRQAWSALGNEQAGGGEMGRFNQGPLPGQEDEWPFEGTFMEESAKTPAADYYPRTM